MAFEAVGVLGRTISLNSRTSLGTFVYISLYGGYYQNIPCGYSLPERSPSCQNVTPPNGTRRR
jgi:hypothetical protein